MIVTASKLNVRSGPGPLFRVLGQLERNDRVAPAESSGDWVWVAPGNGWVHRGYLVRANGGPPAGPAAIGARFGSPGAPQCSAGRAMLPAPLKLSWADAAVTRFACHMEMEAVFTNVFAALFSQGLWGELRTFGGCYSDRKTRGGAKPSTHSWGIAVDLNPETNALGTEGDMSMEVVRVFEAHGFTWGGSWSRPDPMHFQYASNY